MNRRSFLKFLSIIFAKLQFFKYENAFAFSNNKKVVSQLGISRSGYSDIYASTAGFPETTMLAMLEMSGGIDSLIGPDDIVILKPNSQWWNQGMTNTNALKTFIEAILSRPNFSGEIIIADNHQYDEPDSRAWTTELRNGDFNLNELVQYFQEKGFRNVTKYIWRPTHSQLGRHNQDKPWFSNIVKGPWEGDGYVWDKNLVYISPLGRRCLMTYPIFTSSYSGTTVDFKNGAWKNSSYTGQPVKFINFSAINYHSPAAGVTASTKNYMGVVDMSCGYPRGGPSGFFNVHHLGVRQLPEIYRRHFPWRLQKQLEPLLNSLYCHKYFHHTGGFLGAFMRNVRLADLNIITAHWVGYGSRTDTSLSAYPKASIASKDPVALDYWAAKEVLVPAAENSPNGQKFLQYIDPDREDGAFRRFLISCNNEGIGTLSPEKIRVTRNS